MAQKTNKHSSIFLTAGLLLVVFVQLGFCGSGRAQIDDKQSITPLDVSELKSEDQPRYLAYLKRHSKPPAEYVLQKFKNHDVVILGEMHEIKECLEFMRDLIEPLYHEAGVTCFAMEILKSKNIGMANELVTGEEYDQKLALRIFRDCGWPTWGFKEYMDIVKAIWRLNHKLPAEAERFRIIPLSSDWNVDKLYSESWNEEAHDNHMANILAQEVIEKGKKALVQIGYNHSFVRYRQPQIRDGKFTDEGHARFGCVLYDKYGDRIYQIALHHRHFGPEAATGGKPTSEPVLMTFMEGLLRKNRNKPIGFDIENSPFARLRDRKDIYFAFQKEVVFSDIAQGYIFLKPIKEFSRITWAKGFIDKSNFDEAKAVALKRGWIKPGECNTPEQLDEKFKLIFESN